MCLASQSSHWRQDVLSSFFTICLHEMDFAMVQEGLLQFWRNMLLLLKQCRMGSFQKASHGSHTWHWSPQRKVSFTSHFEDNNIHLHLPLLWLSTNIKVRLFRRLELICVFHASHMDNSMLGVHRWKAEMGWRFYKIIHTKAIWLTLVVSGQKVSMGSLSHCSVIVLASPELITQKKLLK